VLTFYYTLFPSEISSLDPRCATPALNGCSSRSLDAERDIRREGLIRRIPPNFTKIIIFSVLCAVSQGDRLNKRHNDDGPLQPRRRPPGGPRRVPRERLLGPFRVSSRGNIARSTHMLLHISSRAASSGTGRCREAAQTSGGESSSDPVIAGYIGRLTVASAAFVRGRGEISARRCRRPRRGTSACPVGQACYPSRPCERLTRIVVSPTKTLFATLPPPPQFPLC